MFFTILAFISAQEWDGVPIRGSIPDELLMPKRGETPHYPVDTVIGELGQGDAPAAAYSFAVSVAEGLYSGATGHHALAQINSVLKERYLSALDKIDPRSFRLGGGRQESDGAVSFMIRFVGREQGITGELFIKFVSDQKEQNAEDEDANFSRGNWIFDELILEDARNHEDEQKDSLQRFDFSPYERFF